MEKYKVVRENGRVIIKDELGVIYNLDDNKSAIETIKNSTSIEYWDKMDIVQQLSDK